MKVVGLITEYNPFHNGHKYHVKEAKKMTDADFVIAVMSGDFVQRGTPAIIDKYSRAEMALNNGVDLVLELPVCYATGSAEFFAHGAVSLLNKLGVVDYLCFGSENGDITLIKEIANLLSEDNKELDKSISQHVKSGLSYPAARLKAIEQHFYKINSTGNYEALIQTLSAPNNILGIEYLKALKHLSSSIMPLTITRKSSGYHDKKLSEDSASMLITGDNADLDLPDSKQVISSATAIRKHILSLKDINNLQSAKASVPKNVYEILKKSFEVNYPIFEEDFSNIIKYKLLSENRISLTRYADLTGDLADRIKNNEDYNLSIPDLAKKLKTKNTTLTRINRALIHLLLNITDSSLKAYQKNGYVPYARVLGLKKDSSLLVKEIKKKGSVPIIMKAAGAAKQLDSPAYNMFSEDIFAATLYNQAVYEKFHTILPNEYQHGAVLR